MLLAGPFLWADSNQELLLAVQTNNAKRALTALRSGANTEVRDFLGNTPLIICAEKGYYEPFKVLIEYGANKEATNFMRRNAIEIISSTLDTSLESPSTVKKINEGRERIRRFMKNYRER